MRVLKRVDESLTRSTLSVVLVSFWRPPGGGNEQANVSGDATADDVLPPRPRLMPRPWPSAGPPMLMTPPVVPSSRKWFDMSKKGTRPSASAGTKTRIRIRRGAEKDMYYRRRFESILCCFWNCYQVLFTVGNGNPLLLLL